LRPHRASRHLRSRLPAEAQLYGVMLLQQKIRRIGTIER